MHCRDVDFADQTDPDIEELQAEETISKLICCTNIRYLLVHVENDAACELSGVHVVCRSIGNKCSEHGCVEIHKERKGT